MPRARRCGMPGRTRETPDLRTIDGMDFVVVGSGFGGSVAALRLAEKGYRVLVIEEGKRWAPEDFPKTNWNLRRYLWLPGLGCYGIQRLDFLGDVLVLGGAGVGGGSLVYANTLVEPPDEAFSDGWPGGPTFRRQIGAHFATARRMLGATRPPRMWPAEDALLAHAHAQGREERFSQPEVSVLFGETEGARVPDPYFGGQGPERSTCRLCGGCMVGCRHDAKNSLDKNYLYLAARLGVVIVPETRATRIEEADGGGYLVHTCSSTGWLGRPRRVYHAPQVVLAAGALGTTDLLLASREAGSLTRLSPMLGKVARTNSEILCGLITSRARVNHSQGLAIASHYQATADTAIEMVRYPAGSDAMGLLATLAVDGSRRWRRVAAWLLSCLRHPLRFLRVTLPFGFARRAVIVLVMQSVDNALSLRRARGRIGSRRLRSRRDPGTPPIPSYLPIANEAARDLAHRLGGFPVNAVNEVLLGTPITAHILGGARMAESPAEGVVDEGCRVFGHPGLYVVDGAAIPANLGANPSLTITAVAEHAMSLIPPASGPHRA